MNHLDFITYRDKSSYSLPLLRSEFTSAPEIPRGLIAFITHEGH